MAQVVSINEDVVNDIVDFRQQSGFRLSLSGGERNHLFLSSGDGTFQKRSALSGANHDADGRAFAWLDFDRDGQLDFAIVNANDPLFLLYRNQINDPATGETVGAENSNHGMLAIRLVGGNHTDQPSQKFSNRDGVGARIELTTTAGRQVRERRAGEGFASQNSGLLYFGLSDAESVEKIEIHWPSGVKQVLKDIPVDSLLTVFEDPESASMDTPYLIEAYTVGVSVPAEGAPSLSVEGQYPLLDIENLKFHAGPKQQAALRMYVGMGTTCPACKRELSVLKHLRSMISEEELEMIGLPLNPEDSSDHLATYRALQHPPYHLLDELPDEVVAQVKQMTRKGLLYEGFPVFVITNPMGRVLSISKASPTVSELRKLQTK